MRINANNLIQPSTISAGSGGMTMPDQGADFADRMGKAVQASEQAKTTATTGEDAKLKAACKEMEAVFLNMMMTRMRATVPKDGLFGNSQEEQMLTSMLDTELTKNMAQAGGMGLADMLYRQLSKTTVKSQAAR
ncbi:Peptidoglycan hydrolase FlgJ [Sporomusa ovata DSM 2662]|uniref:Flagellar protein FlgJ [peptidoglycan hydrolase] n=1 Tax=Sporomusa ovata TaxID=2378 RepID=A0A0U1KU29_9FIRM|nr:rod-binding protein [Sporomusa ovata]EQB26522.1 Rod binding protein [Sporomusa ovata DSM 2662]CQR70609.1 Flagellar protein FlgJ [peptidoglycan hydrolase] [Sporomusa ovata]